MKVTMTNKSNPEIKTTYKDVVTCHVGTYADYGFVPHWHLLLHSLPTENELPTATFCCSEWNIEVEE